MITEYIKTPLNYTGNKLRILNQIQPHFPKQINVMVDLFCGGATVGTNTECKKIIFIDNEPMVIGLLKFFANNTFNNLISDIEKILESYDLSNSYRNGYSFYKKNIKDSNFNNGLKEYNSDGFYQLRSDYNLLKNKNTKKAYTMLYVLLLYGFNNDLRFNSKKEYNLPIGKTDSNKTNVKKLMIYMNKIKDIDAEYICDSFISEKVQDIIYNQADFVYMDPPYLITNAVYNESNHWNNDFEHQLLDFIDTLIKKEKPFVLSNVIRKSNRTNEPLCYWVEKRKEHIEICNIKYDYRSASYNKKIRDCKEEEIIIKLKENKNNEDK